VATRAQSANAGAVKDASDAMADVYNLLKSNAVTAEVTAIRLKYVTPSSIAEGRLMRPGFELHF
jgi:hypothetical protein